MTRTNIVPFERPAAYWAVRARRHHAPSQLPDAARLMRKALEKNGDPALALELAEIYLGMESYSAAECCLLRFAARQGISGSLCFLIGLCALGRGEEELAERALDQSLRLDPEGLFSQRAQDLLETYPWRYGLSEPHCARSETLRCRSLRSRSREDALLWAREAWKKGRSAQAALWLGTLLPPRQGIPYLRYAVKKTPWEIRPRLILADACRHLGRPWETKRQLLAAAKTCRSISDAEAFCQTAWAVGWPRAALKLAEEKLAAAPGSADWLKLRYLSLRRMPGCEAQADRALKTLLETDPDDADGLRWRRHPKDRQLNPGRAVLLSALGSLVYSMPERLRFGRLNRILHFLVVSLNGTVDAETVYALAVPAWRRLTEAEKRSCDERRDRHFPQAFLIYLLLRTGHAADAQQHFQSSWGKKRILRLLHRFLKAVDQGEKKED